MRMALLALLLAASPTFAETLTVRVTGAGDGGQVVAALYDKADGFSGFDIRKAKAVQRAPVKAGAATVRFEGLKPGRYAISAFHDADGNDKVRTNLIGMPREAVGVSNNPGGMPGFQKSLVEVPATAPIDIQLRKIGG